MSVYLLLKTVHILSATVLFGTGLGIAYFKWSTDRTQDPAAIRAVSDRVVTADWLFTLPTAILQPVTGLALAGGETFASDLVPVEDPVPAGTGEWGRPSSSRWPRGPRRGPGRRECRRPRAL